MAHLKHSEMFRMNRLMDAARTFAVAAAVSAVASTALTASAHTSSVFYTGGGTGGGGTWPLYKDVRFLVRSGFPSHTPSYASIINKGFNQWSNETSGSGPDFYNDGGTTLTGNADNPCLSPYNGVYWRNLDYLGTGVLGFTPHCESSVSNDDTVNGFSMSIDTRTWYVDTGTPTSTQYDLYSVVTHEAGHATGWSGHFSSTETICDTDLPATMCPYYRVGNIRWRTLSTHDVHTFVGAY